MGVLTVNEGGEARAFRISEGTLRVGSSAEMDLALEEDDVASFHAELLCEGDQLFVTPQPGVLPPTIQGVALKQKTRLAPGQELRVGRAKLSWRPEETQAGGAPSSPAKAAPPRSTAASPSKSTKKSTAPKRASGAGRLRTAGSTRRSSSSRASTKKSGVPGWLIVVGLLAAAGLALFLLKDGLSGSNEVANTANAKFHLRKAEEMIDSRNADAAEENLGKIVKSILSPAELVRFESVEAGIVAERAEIERLADEERGNKWFRRHVDAFEERYLSGDPEPPKIRWFLELCAEFERRYPSHSRLEWVERQRRRFASAPALSTPLTFDDVIWRADYLTGGRPRDYEQALAALAEYRERAEGSDERIAVANRIVALEAERAEYHREQLEEARKEFDRGRVGEATERLAQLVMKLGDQELEDEAAGILVQFPKIAGVLLGYKEQRPEDFERLSKNAVIANFLREQGL